MVYPLWSPTFEVVSACLQEEPLSQCERSSSTTGNHRADRADRRTGRSPMHKESTDEHTEHGGGHGEACQEHSEEEILPGFPVEVIHEEVKERQSQGQTLRSSPNLIEYTDKIEPEYVLYILLRIPPAEQGSG